MRDHYRRKSESRVDLKFGWIVGAMLGAMLAPGSVWATTPPAPATRLSDAQALYQAGQYFKSARYAFAASEEDAGRRPEAYSWITAGLVKAKLYNAGSYFFIRTLQTGDKTAIRRVLPFTQELLVRVGGDVLRKYLIRHTTYEDYDLINRSAYLYALAKDALLDGKNDKTIGYVNGISSKSPLYPYALHLRASAHAISGQSDAAIRDFQKCADRAEDYVSNRKEVEQVSRFSRASEEDRFASRQTREAEDLHDRCLAGEARVLYEKNRFDEADRAYDRIPKASFVYTDILFEQAWNSFAREEYNRSLGKLVSYKSPALRFVFNSEVDVLTAQSYLALCLYPDANEVVNQFNAKYTKVGEEIKKFVERNSNDLFAFHEFGKEALAAPLHTTNQIYRLANRFIRGPYFQNLVQAERATQAENNRIRDLAAADTSVKTDPGQGFPGFLTQVLKWRQRSVRLLGGAFIKNSLIDYHAVLLSDFDKMSFIKLEMLSRAKDKLLGRQTGEDRSRGSIEPSRRDDQYYWSFNGEFWNDELGDYVFGLESECKS